MIFPLLNILTSFIYNGDIYCYMKKLREFDDMDWIRDTSSNLNGSAIVFEPMVDETVWPKIVNLVG